MTNKQRRAERRAEERRQTRRDAERGDLADRKAERRETPPLTGEALTRRLNELGINERRTRDRGRY